VAAKTVLTGATAQETDDLLQEAIVMSQVGNHPNLVSIVGAITSGTPMVLVLSYCEHGSFQDMLKKGKANTSSALTAKGKLGIISGVATGMAHLGAKRFVHRDLAARNCLVSTGMIAKVADFGLSRSGVSSSGYYYYKSQSGVFPIRWTAPEAMSSMRFTSESDVWSFGIVMLEAFTDGARPYPTWGTELVMLRVMGGYRAPQPPGCPDDVYKIMMECWAEDPSGRPTFQALADQTTRQAAGTNTQAKAVGEFEWATLALQNAALPDATNTSSVLIAETSFVDAAPLHTAALEYSLHVSEYGRCVGMHSEAIDIDSMLSVQDALAATELVSLDTARTAAVVHCHSPLETELDEARTFAAVMFASESGQALVSKYGLTEEDVATIHFYTQECRLYICLNGALGGWGDGGVQALPHYLPFAKLLISVLDKLPAVQAEVYRGVRGVPLDVLLNGCGVNDVLIWRAFTSVTLSSDVLRDPTFLGVGAEHGERVVFVILTISGVWIQAFSAKGKPIHEYLQPAGTQAEQDEQELLLKPGSAFVITSITPMANYITEVRMTEIPSPEATASTVGAATVNADESTGTVVLQTLLAPNIGHPAGGHDADAGYLTVAGEFAEYSANNHTPLVAAAPSTMAVEFAEYLAASNHNVNADETIGNSPTVNNEGSHYSHGLDVPTNVRSTPDGRKSSVETAATAEKVHNFIAKLERDVRGVYEIVDMLNETVPRSVRAALSTQAKVEIDSLAGNQWLDPSNENLPLPLILVNGTAQPPTAAAYTGHAESIPVQRTASDEFVESIMALDTLSAAGYRSSSDFAEPNLANGYLMPASDRGDRLLSDSSRSTTSAAATNGSLYPQDQPVNVATPTPHFLSVPHGLRDESESGGSGPFRQISEC
jgi:hypothetical protein